MEARYRITINKRGFIPGVGNGPINRPISVKKSLYESLKKLGYPITVVSDPTTVAKGITERVAITTPTPVIPTKEVKPEIVSPTIEEIVENGDIIESDDTTTVVEDVVEEVVEEEIVEEDVEEILVDDKDLSAGAYYNEAFLTSKNICKKILDARVVQYADDASFANLKKAVMESNPEVNFAE